MHRIDSNLISETLPTPKPDSAHGYFQDDDPLTGGTEVTADWLNAVQEEIVSVIAEAGTALSKTDNTQLLAAIRALGQQHALFVHETATGVNAELVTVSTFTKRPVTEKVNHIPGCSVTDGVITLPAGTYYVRGFGVLGCTGDETYHFTQAGIFEGDSGAAADLLVQGLSTGLRADYLDASNVTSFVEGELVLAVETDITFRQYSNVVPRHMGYASNITGFAERYAALQITRLGA